MYGWKTVVVCVILCLEPMTCLIRDIAICHADFENEPADGVLKEFTFTWLGFAQYNHAVAPVLNIKQNGGSQADHASYKNLPNPLKAQDLGPATSVGLGANCKLTTGLPHQSMAPRVILVHKQFVLGTAMDMMRLPKNYKLGNFVFGDYERDEEECGLTQSQIKLGLKCTRAYIEIPPLDITPHPEFTRFGVGNSLALVKLIRPMKSNYMIPLCLPTIIERARKKNVRTVYLVDYISSVPKDFDSERLAKKTLKLFTHKECKKHRMRGNLGGEGVTHVLCSSGCGVRPGAPIISHAKDGSYQLIGMTAGGGPCGHRSMRDRLNNDPPLYIDVYPYNTWIMNVIMAHHQPKPYPQHVMLVDAGGRVGINKSYLRKQKVQKSGWSGRNFLFGSHCYSDPKTKKTAEYFYFEKFEVNANPPARLSVFLKISAGVECTIVCARMALPNRQVKPLIEGLPGYNISVSFHTDWFPYTFFFSLGLDVDKGLTTDDRKEVWQGKQLHGRYYRVLHGPDVDFLASVSWLRFSDLFGETERLWTKI